MSAHMRLPNAKADTDTITCASCEACCCKLQVFVMAGDDVPDHFIDFDQWNAAVMRRASDGWCAALSRDTLLCTIYERRPAVCREYAMGGGDCIDERALHAIGVPVTVPRTVTKS